MTHSRDLFGIEPAPVRGWARLRFVSGGKRGVDMYYAEVDVKGRVAGRGSGISAARAFQEAMTKAGSRGGSALPRDVLSPLRGAIYRGETVSFAVEL